ncbi:MAG: carboxymuconolactone decarboxylase family protein [Alphaproteobacteria bacterium]
MPRLQPVAAKDYTPEQKRIADMISGQRKAPVRGPFGVLLHAPEICEMFANFVDLSLDEEKSRIPLRLKELAIITVGRVFGSDYEWFIHAKRAVEFGINADAVEEMRQNRIPIFPNADEKLIYDVAKELAETRQLSDANYQRAFDHFGKEAMVELAALVGFYHTVSVVLNVFQVEAPEGDPYPMKG